MNFETYRIVIYHEMTDTKGNRVQLEQPFHFTYSQDRSSQYYVPTPVFLNAFLDRVKDEVLRYEERKGEEVNV